MLNIILLAIVLAVIAAVAMNWKGLVAYFQSASAAAPANGARRVGLLDPNNGKFDPNAAIKMTDVRFTTVCTKHFAKTSAEHTKPQKLPTTVVQCCTGGKPAKYNSNSFPSACLFGSPNSKKRP